jgi:phytoene desaturase
MILARRGVSVTVLEAEPQVGGRNAAIRLGPYTFDTGPTFLMLKDILDEVLAEAGATTADVLQAFPLDPMYRLQFRDRTVNVASDAARMCAEIERVFPGKGARLEKFMQREKTRFTRLYPCLQKSYHRATTLLHPDLLRALPHLALGRSLYDIMFGYFGDEQLALTFTFQAKYIGMSPWECPGLFSIIPYIEHAYGIYHTTGGLSRISDAMADVARRNGAEIRLSTPVKQVLVRDGAARGVELEDGSRLEADDVVINADFGYAMTHLIPRGTLRKWSPENLARRRFSCSTFMLYLGLDTQYDLAHHTIYFAEDYRTNVERIFSGGPLSNDMSVYVRNASRNDPTLAPPGHSALYVLVPVPNCRGAVDWSAEKGPYREAVLDAIEKRAGLQGLRGHIREERVITPDDWEGRHRVYAGATFNLAHNVGQMVYFRPRNRFEEIDRCYLVGGGTHPGSGLPTIYESGRITANLLCRAYGVPFESRNLHV